MKKNEGIHIISGFSGKAFDAELKFLIKDVEVGGLIFFSHNVEDPVQLAELCARIQRYAIDILGRPLFIAIDHEGGRVQRCRKPFTIIPPASELSHNKKDVSTYASIASRELKLVGINMNLAPVADISPTSPHQFLLGRTYGDNPETVSLNVLEVIQVTLSKKIIPTIKHFPGLGEAIKDPHKTLPTIDRSLQELFDWELIPFKRAIDAGTPCVMTSHALYPDLDPQLPATLSRKILVELLREKLRFKGTVISDDLEMGAISTYGDFDEIINLAIEAQNDFLLLCHDLELVTKLSDLLRKLPDKDLSRYHHASVERITKLFNLIDKSAVIPDVGKVREYFKL